MRGLLLEERFNVASGGKQKGLLRKEATNDLASFGQWEGLKDA
jgi:hypothetical protein